MKFSTDFPFKAPDVCWSNILPKVERSQFSIGQIQNQGVSSRYQRRRRDLPADIERRGIWTTPFVKFAISVTDVGQSVVEADYVDSQG